MSQETWGIDWKPWHKQISICILECFWIISSQDLWCQSGQITPCFHMGTKGPGKSWTLVKKPKHICWGSSYGPGYWWAACVLCITKLCPISIQDISLNKQDLQIPAQCQWNLALWREDPLTKAKENKGTYQRSNAMAVANMATTSAIDQRRQGSQKSWRMGHQALSRRVAQQ